MKKLIILVACGLLALAGCSKEEPVKLYLSFYDSKLSLGEGETAQLKLFLQKGELSAPEDYDLAANSKNVVFSSSKPTVATVDANGLVTAVKSGTSVITASIDGDLTNAAECTVTVKSAVESAPELKIGSFNLWVHATGTEQWAWALRKPVLAQSIVENGFDIFGFQEADVTIQNELPAAVSKAGRDYTWWFFGRDAQDGSSGEAVGIAYDATKFDISDKHFFWLSPTPDVLSYGWGETTYHRVGVCATFTIKATGAKFFFMATHGPLDDTANSNAAEVLLAREKMYNTGNLPSFLVGDMNAHYDSPLSVTCRTWWKDPCLELGDNLKTGPLGTFNNHSITRDLTTNTNYRIDYVYYRSTGNHLYVYGYRVNDTKYTVTYNGSPVQIYPSDHLPVYITARVY